MWPLSVLAQGRRLVAKNSPLWRPCSWHVCHHAESQAWPARSGLGLVLQWGGWNYYSHFTDREPRFRGVKRDAGSPTASMPWSGELKSPVPTGLRRSGRDHSPPLTSPRRVSLAHRRSGHTEFFLFSSGPFPPSWFYTYCSSAW